MIWVCMCSAMVDEACFPPGLSGRRPKGYCRYLRLSVCPFVCLSVSTSACKLYLIRVVTRNRFELESPNLHQSCILGLFRSVLKLGEGGHWPWPSRSFGHFDSISAFNGAFVYWFRPAKGCVAHPNVLLYISAFHMFWKLLQVDICILLCVGVIYAAIISQALGLVYIVEGAFDSMLHLTIFYRTLLPIKTSTLSSTKIIVSSNKRHRVKFMSS